MLSPSVTHAALINALAGVTESLTGLGLLKSQFHKIRLQPI